MTVKHPLFQRECSKCGAPLLFLKTAEGKTIPLDLRAPVFGVAEYQGQKEAVRTTMHFVSHFSTCPYANEFSKSKKENES